nr:hypothetical protein OG690_29415 [Streptomyces tubercidicus]
MPSQWRLPDAPGDGGRDRDGEVRAGVSVGCRDGGDRSASGVGGGRLAG